ncbi:barstar family protein [Butyrivibrio sp. NC2007]|uniref:barstar family protein n=1 Tax=Butyrivibrio sp. NC2007 TaxID=1280683 RepID=UPI0003B30122|nr:barstar family protein [Butyrivibrio sp. NC2007]
MEQVFYIDLSNVTAKSELHDTLAKELPLPEHYGHNLDAFYDVLTETTETWNIIIYNTSAMEKENPDYLNRLKKLASRAQKESNNLKIRFYP